MKTNTEKLFSYGTLQYESVQHETFGRKLQGSPDILKGYKLDKVQITDPKVLAASGDEYHPILVFTGNPSDEVSGVVFDITTEELQQADRYEVADYKRISVELHSKIQAWVYISAS